jgi:anti-sigma factor RsiW
MDLMQHPDPLRLQACFDGEVDAMTAADIELHIQQCPQCQSTLQELERARAALRNNLTDYRAPASLRASLQHALDRESGDVAPRAAVSRSRTWSARSFWLGGLSGGGFAAAAVTAFAFLVWIPRVSPIGNELVSAHVRSLISSHPIDVVSTDKHTVKPWFAGHADVSPEVADFETQGYRLIGGRADYLEHQRVAVMVYQHGAHTIDVFSMAGNSRIMSGNTTRDGYHVNCWKSGDLNYCAVSDAGWSELQELERLLRDLSAHDTPE